MIRISNIRERNSLGETDKKFDMEIDGKNTIVIKITIAKIFQLL